MATLAWPWNVTQRSREHAHASVSMAPSRTPGCDLAMFRCSHTRDMPGHDPAYTFVPFVVHLVALTKKEKRGPTPSGIPAAQRLGGRIVPVHPPGDGPRL